MKRSRRIILRQFAATAVCGGMMEFALPANAQCTSQSDYNVWVSRALGRMLTIKVGMTRNQLMEIFTKQGGINPAKENHFVSRDCGYFKVNVKFRRAEESDIEDESAWLDERDDDVITSI